MSKRSDAIEIMKENANQPMSVTVGIIADTLEVTVLQARAYYRWIVNNELAPGVVEDARLRGVETLSEEPVPVPAPKARFGRPKLPSKAQAKASTGLAEVTRQPVAAHRRAAGGR